MRKVRGFRWIVFSPLFWLAIAVIAVIVVEAMVTLAFSRYQIHGEAAGYSQRLLFCYLMGWWLSKDARKHMPGFPTDWGFLAGAVVLPVYFITARGWRGFGKFLLVVAGIVAIQVVGVVIRAAMSF